MQRTKTLSMHLPELFPHQSRDFRLSKVQRATSSPVQQTVKSEEGCARAEVLTGECSLRWQASGEPPGDEGGGSGSVSVWQTAAIDSHFLTSV